MVEWDNKWYAAWTMLLERLTLRDLEVLAAAVEAELGSRKPDFSDRYTEEDCKREWIGVIGDRLREMRGAVEYQKLARDALGAMRKLMGVCQ